MQNRQDDRIAVDRQPDPELTGTEPTAAMSGAQQALALIAASGEANQAYVICRATRLHGALDVDRLERCLQVLVARHPALRIRLVREARGWRQQQLAAAAVGPAEFVRGSIAAEEADGDALAWRVERGPGRAFDLQRAPLVRAACWSIDPRQHLFVLAVHHIVGDGTSLALLHRELGRLYAGDGAAVELPVAAWGPIEFANEERARRAAGEFDSHRDYWQQALEATPALDLPTDFLRDSQARYAGATLRVPIERSLGAALRALASRHGTTRTRVYLAAFQVLLMRLAGVRDVAVGLPAAVRRGAHAAHSVGYLVNTLAIRARVDESVPAPGFADFLAATHARVEQALLHAELPFAEVVSAAAAVAQPGRNPLCQAAFSLESIPDRALQLPGMSSEYVELLRHFSLFDLSVAVFDDEQQGAAYWRYRSDLFEAGTIRSFAQAYLCLLREIVDEPSRAIDRLALTDEAARHALLREFQAPPRAFPLDTPLHELISAQAVRDPEAIALQMGSQRMSYARLERLSTDWAGWLLDAGVGPEDLVAVCLPRGPAMVVCLLAVAKAGAAFLGLDPEHPRQRLLAMLEDASPRAVMTAPAWLDASTLAERGCRVFSVPDSAQAPQAAAGSMARTLPRSLPRHLAYVIYTSGSTGTPKGALIQQQGLRNVVHVLCERLALTRDDGLLLSTSIAFDAMIWRVFAPLVRGARLVLAEPGSQADMRRMLRILAEQRVTIAGLVPSLLRALLDEPAEGLELPLRHMICGGEPLDPALAKRFLERFPGARLSNSYGPSETSICSNWLDVESPHCDPRLRMVPVGRPLPNVRVHVLDAQGQLQPVGASGELHIAGIGVGRGYLRREDLSAERFVADPWEPGGRMYRTGDVARWRADGSLEFLGRADQQVKLRGLRIELGEIEAVLRLQAGVRQAAVVVHGQDAGVPRLVAYAVADELDAPALRKSLRQALPEYMVPASFVRMDALPRLPSGKIDRKALAEPRERAQAAPTAARSPLEAMLLEIWQSVLHRSGFGVHEDFYALGGHSLNVTQVASHIQSSLGVELPLQALFDHRTVAELAAEIQRRMRGGCADAAQQGIERIARDGPLALSFSQQRMWLLYQLDPESGAYNVRLALRLVGPLDRKALQLALDELVARHEAFRTRVQLSGELPHARIDPPTSAHIEDLAIDDTSADAALRERAVFDAAARRAAMPFDLERGPLHRLLLARIADDHHLLVLAMHHIVTDDWSLALLVREFNLLYEAHSGAGAARLPQLELGFADYAAWQRRQFGGEAFASQLHYWLQRLRGMSPLNLPVDKGNGRREGSRGARLRVPLSDAWLLGLQSFGARQGVTPFMTLYAAFASLLGRWCGQHDVAVGFPIAGRTRLESETLVGSLVNTLVLRTRVDPELSFGAFLHEEVRPAALGAFSHQDLPFDHLVERLRASGSPGGGVQPRVLFNVLNSPHAPLRFSRLQASHVSLPSEWVQFDLSLTVSTEGLKALILDYSTELFEPASMQELAQLYLEGLQRALADPAQALHRLWSASPSQRERIARWNDTAMELPRAATVIELLERQRNRRAIALRDAGGVELDYPTLWAAVAQLAQRLRAQGIGRGCFVGLGMQRGVDMVVAQLAVLQTGAAYVPLDPEFPRARLRAMIDDARPALVLADEASRPGWDGFDVALFVPPRAGAVPAPQADRAGVPPAGTGATPQDPAYMIYTSGSTGKPKGVLVPHHAVVNFLVSMARAPGMGPDDVLLAVTTLSFDIAVLELLLGLYVGACVCIATRDEAADAQALQQRLQASSATMMQATPATWRMLLDAGWQPRPGFRALIGGEALHPELAGALRERCAQVWNLYGPTETTVWSTCWKVPREAARISIGAPIANTRVHVLDEFGEPCPIGFSGEIHIAGDGVAIGYHQRPELTRERFLPESAAGGAARMYRTGDRGRWRHDGRLEHQGRLDFQVKLRGYRIETGDIESALLRQPGVAECVVVLRDDLVGGARLVAYVAPQPGQQPLAAQLREALRTELPGYMVPQGIDVLQALPRLPNGKVDRHALPAPGEGVGSGHAVEDPPQGPVEELLAGIWRELLGVPEVRRSDNFFDVGGHSLLANQVASRFAAATGQRLPLRRMVHETLAQLAVGVQLPAGNQAQAPAPAARSSWLQRFGRRWARRGAAQ